MTAINAARGLGGRGVLCMFAGFFAVVLAVNITMIWLALGSFPGLVTDRAYDLGLTYNRNLEAAAAQARLGWQAQIDTGARSDATWEIDLSLRDAAGGTVSGGVIAGRLERPVDPSGDVPVTLVETEAGHYRASLPTPEAGLWNLHLRVERGADRFVADYRLALP